MIPLFDANCRIGKSDLSTSDGPATAVELLAEMDRIGIAEALVHHAWSAAYSVPAGNRQLLDAVAGHDRLHRCWAALPHYTGEIEAPLQLLDAMQAANVRAVRLWPTLHRFSLAPWSIDQLLAALASRRIPAFLDFNRAHWADDVVDYGQVARICETFPDLPVVLVREGFGSSRYLYALWNRFENLYVEISYYQSSGGIADIVQRFGPERLLFGTGMPEYAGGPAISMLQHAEISEGARMRIGCENMRALLAGGR